jgi:hypothetical protein
MAAYADFVRLVIDFSAKNVKSVVIGIVLTPVFFYAISSIYGVTPKTHFEFLMGGNPYAERYRLISKHLNSVNNEVSDYERLSHERQLDLFKILDNNIQVENELASTLKIVNRNHDIVRALMEFGKFHSVLVVTEQDTEETQQALRNMYKGYLNILKGDNDITFIDKAYKLFKNVYDDLSNFPNPLREDVEVELLNFLTYCSFRKDYPDKAARYTTCANELLSRQSPDATTYRRKFYWIDLNTFMTAIVHIDSDKASTAFSKLRNSLNDDKFLKAKLLQHSSKVSGSDNKDLLLEYIREL